MKNFSDNFSAQEAMQFIRTPAGQQLVKMLQESKDQNLVLAKELIAKGDIEGAKNVLQGLATSAQMQDLLSNQEGK